MSIQINSEDKKVQIPMVRLPSILNSDGIIKNIKDLVFRRVARVNTKETDKLQTLFFKNDEDFEVCAQDREFTQFELDHNVEERYSEFSFFSSQNALRDNDPCPSVPIYGHSKNYATLDIIEGCTFRFIKHNDDIGKLVPPKANEKVKDLICGLVAPSSRSKGSYFRYWFICSEQFFRAWTAIMYEKHDSLGKKGISIRRTEEKKAIDSDQIKRFLFTGNRLCTANYKKFLLAMVDNQNFSENNEKSNKYFRLRTEPLTRQWVHIYASLVLMMRYEEYPCEYNLPVNLSSSIKHLSIKHWDLPEGWLDKLVKKYNIQFAPSRSVMYSDLLIFEVGKDVREKNIETEKEIKDIQKISEGEFELQTEDFPPLK